MGQFRRFLEPGERVLEAYFVKKVKETGALTYKFTSPGQRGVPDRIVLLPNGDVHFVELKTVHGCLSPLQERTLEVFRAYKLKTFLLFGKYGKDGVINYVEYLGRVINGNV